MALDLGCGTGATVRAFARCRGALAAGRPRPALLALAAARCPAAEIVAADLADLDRLPLDGVAAGDGLGAARPGVARPGSRRWPARLAAAGIGLYAALSYDGTMAWEPRCRTMRGRRGLQRAPAARQGPRAGARARRRRRRWRGPSRARGYAVRTAPSPWRLGAGRRGAAARRWSTGVAEAAAEAGRVLASGLASGAASAAGRLHGRPRRPAGAAAERAVEDHVGVEPVDVGLRPQRVGEPGDRRGAQARPGRRR